MKWRQSQSRMHFLREDGRFVIMLRVLKQAANSFNGEHHCLNEKLIKSNLKVSLEKL